MKKKVVTMLVALLLPLALFANSAFAYYPADTLLYQGMHSSDVTALQRDLRNLGYMGGSPTGYFGSYTRQAVLDFQRANYLYVDGVVGKQTARELKADMIVKTAKQYRGVPYVWGGTSPSGFDCSGFTHYVFLKNDITISRTASLQYDEGTWVSKSNLKPGDLVFFSTYKPGPSHVGIYIGSGKFVNASSGSNAVITADLNNPYWINHYLGAKRIIN